MTDRGFRASSSPGAGRPGSMRSDAAVAAERYDCWFDRPWGRYAFGIESQALLDALGAVDGSLVLDAGCGTGRFAVRVARAGGRVVGLDVDPAMVGVAAGRLPAPCTVGDIGHLPFRDGAFDVAVAVAVLEFVPDPEHALAELTRVTRRGGRVAVGALNRRSPWGIAHRRRGEPWSGARFLAPGDLARLGDRHGDATVSGWLHAPGPWPGIRRWGPWLERVGRRFPERGAFQVLVVRRR